MSASANLSAPQFLSIKRLGRLTSGDYEVPMNQVIPHPTMGSAGRLSTRGHPGVSGGSRNYSMDEMTQDIAQHGVHQPVELNAATRGRGYFPDIRVTEGHHRYVAARDAGLPRVPVDYGTGIGPEDVVNVLAHYTPPNRNWRCTPDSCPVGGHGRR